MVLAKARACAVSVTPGNNRRSSTAADSSPALIEGGTDRGGLGLGDNEHAGRMGARTEGDKRPWVTNRCPTMAVARQRHLSGSGIEQLQFD